VKTLKIVWNLPIKCFTKTSELKGESENEAQPSNITFCEISQNANSEIVPGANDRFMTRIDSDPLAAKSKVAGSRFIELNAISAHPLVTSSESNPLCSERSAFEICDR
jgi:hypothetical protein